MRRCRWPRLCFLPLKSVEFCPSGHYRWILLVLPGWYFSFPCFFFLGGGAFVLEYGMLVSPKVVPFWNHTRMIKYFLRSLCFLAGLEPRA